MATIDSERRHHHEYVGIAFAPLWQLLKGAALLVSTDTSVAHFGRIVAVPTITLFGPGSARLFGVGDFWRDALYRAVTIEDFPCRDQHKLFRRDIPWVRHCTRGLNECPSNRCMQALDVDMVLSTVESLRQAQSEVE